jgi:hypothetical protein
MKFNLQLKNELTRYEKIVATESSATTAPIREAEEKPQPPQLRDRPSEKVVGGDILWKPVDRQAAMLLAKAPWWAQPPQVATPKPEPEKKQTKPKKERTRMVKHASELVERNGDVAVGTEKKWIVFGDWAIEAKGICKRTGQPLMDEIDAWPILLESMNKMKHELTPAALAMIDGEKALRDATRAAKECMEETRSASKVLLDEVRQSKYAMLAEVSALVTPLKELRQFFIGSDYKEQVTRLSEFVDLCERMQKLKDSGFLDSVADTMLRLAEREAV